MPMKHRQVLKWVVAIATFGVICITLGYYLLQYIPEQREYFTSLRFRALAVMGNQLRSKIGNLHSSLDNLCKAKGADKASYIGALLPDLDLAIKARPADPECKATGFEFAMRKAGTRLSFGFGDSVATVPVSSILADITPDDLFADIILALADGTVVFQRSELGPRLLDARELLAAAQESQAAKAVTAGEARPAKDAPVDRSPSKPHLFADVPINGSKFQVFEQNIRLDLDSQTTNLVIYGLVPSSRVSDEIQHVSPKNLLWILAPLVIIGLGGPMLKLVLLPKTARVELRDVFSLTICTILASGLGILVLLSWDSFYVGKQQVRSNLQQLAKTINQDLTSNFSELLEKARYLDQMAAEADRGCPPAASCLPRSSVPYVPAVVDLWNPNNKKPLPYLFVEDGHNFDFVLWADEKGEQLEKWTTKRLPTFPAPLTRSEHFVNMRGRDVFTLRGSSGMPFTLQGLVSPNTSDLIWIMSLRSQRGSVAFGRGNAGSETPQPKKDVFSISMVAESKDLLRPLLPPGVGFAILESSGKVLLHSRPERNQQENFLSESDDGGAIRKAIRTSAEISIAGNYRGREHIFHVRPFTSIVGHPWHIVAFQEIESLQEHVWRVAGSVLVVYLVAFGLSLLLLVVMVFFSRKLWSYTPQGKLFAAMSTFWPLKNSPHVYLLMLVLLIILVGLRLVLISLLERASIEWHGLGMIMSLLIPAAGVLVAFCIQNCFKSSQEPDKRTGLARLLTRAAGYLDATILKRLPIRDANLATGWLYTLNLGLLCFLLGVLTASGIYRTFHNHESSLEVMQLQQALTHQLLDRWEKDRSELFRSEAYTKEGKEFVETQFLAPYRCGGQKLQQVREYMDVFLTNHKLDCLAGDQQANLSQTPDWFNWADSLRKWLPVSESVASSQVEQRGSGAKRDWTWGTIGNDSVVQLNATLIEPLATGAKSLHADLRTLSLQSEIPLMDLPFRPGWSFACIICSVLLLIWIRKTTRLAYLMDFEDVLLPTLHQAFVQPQPRKRIMLLGLPLSGKDGEIKRELDQLPDTAYLRINLYEESFYSLWAETQMEVVERALFPPLVMHTTASTPSSPPPAQTSKQRWVHVSNLECKLNTPSDRKIVLDFLARLLRKREDGNEINVVITSTFDPMAHFQGMLKEEVAEGYTNSLPELDLQGWGRLLNSFKKALLPRPVVPETLKDQPWKHLLAAECDGHKELIQIFDDVVAEPHDEHPDPSFILSKVAEKASVFYQLAWASCTRPEKLLLVQLAQTGFVNPKCLDTLIGLKRKRLVTIDPRPRIMNFTLRNFLLTVEDDETVRKWEKEGGESSWPLIRNILTVIVIGALLVVAATQRQAFQSLATMVTSIGIVLTGLFKAFEIVARRRVVSGE